MTTGASLRRTLRKLPACRLLSVQELDIIAAQILQKEYKSGDVLWRTGTELDFLGVIQSGEMVIERRIKGLWVRSVRLFAGDVVQSPISTGKDSHSIFLARASTDLSLWVLRKEYLANLPSTAAVLPAPPRLSTQKLIPNLLWSALVVFLIVFLSWHELSRILSGGLYFMSEKENQRTYDSEKTVRILGYAESLDPSAVFAHNREGYIWFQKNDLERAELAFSKGYQIDSANGPTLNNMAVTYFVTNRTQDSMVFQKNAVQNDPDNAIVRYNLGLILMQQGFNVDAIREFRQASYIDPSWALPCLEQGFAYLQMRDYMNAEQSARFTIRLDSNQKEAYLILGIALFNQGRNQEALDSIEYALQIDHGQRVAQFYKAMILSDLGQYDAALTILQELLDVSGDPKQVSRITAEIEQIYRTMQSSSLEFVKGGE